MMLGNFFGSSYAFKSVGAENIRWKHIVKYSQKVKVVSDLKCLAYHFLFGVFSYKIAFNFISGNELDRLQRIWASWDNLGEIRLENVHNMWKKAVNRGVWY